MYRPFRALSLFFTAFPGRCPGLVCLALSGLLPDKLNVEVAANRHTTNFEYDYEHRYAEHEHDEQSTKNEEPSTARYAPNCRHFER